MEKMKIGIIWQSIYYYHAARLKALSEKMPGRVVGIEIYGKAEAEWMEKWHFGKNVDFSWMTLFGDKNKVSSLVIFKKIVEVIEKEKIDTLIIGGYYPKEMAMLIKWAAKNKKQCFLFNASKKDDGKRILIREICKKHLLSKISGALCAGKKHQAYFEELGLPKEKIFLSSQAVDNDFFRKGADAIRSKQPYFQKKHNLPEKFFLIASRFIPRKNLTTLLYAYKSYREKCKKPWSLVLVGAGPEDQKMRKIIFKEKIEGVVFRGSARHDELVVYYGLASCFILPSLKDQWGLTINEAMASGLPVLISKIVGATEMVLDGENGFLINPYDVNDMAKKMCKMSNLSRGERTKMSQCSQLLVREYSLEKFCDAVNMMLTAAKKKNDFLKIAEDKRIVILWESMPAFLCRCILSFVKRYHFRVMVVFRRKNLVASDNYLQNNIHDIEIIDLSDLSGVKISAEELTDRIRKFAPKLIIAPLAKFCIYSKVLLNLKSSGYRIVGASDNFWKKSWRDFLNLILSKTGYFKRRYNSIWVPGEWARDYANKIGFIDSDIDDGLYSADSELFNAAYYRKLKKYKNAMPQRFVFIGRYVDLKGIDCLLKAYKNYSKECSKPWGLCFVGDGDLKYKIRACKGVTDYGYKTQSELSDILVDSSCLILPSRSDHWALVIHEACSAGMTILCSDKCGASNQLVTSGVNGYIFNWKDVKELTSLMHRISSSDFDIGKFCSNSFILSKKYSSDMWADKLMRMIEKRGIG